MSPNDPLPERAQQQLASYSAQDRRLSESAPTMPPAHPALRRVLALLTYAQRRELPGIVAECRTALDALCTYLMADRPPLNQLTGEAHQLAVSELVAAHQQLVEARAMLAAVTGDIGVPRALILILEGGTADRPYLQALAGQARSDLDSLQDAVTGPAPVQPQLPTGDYCLLSGFRVRWIGETEVQPLLWRVLDYLLRHEGDPFPVRDLEDVVWGEKAIASKTLANTLSRLNNALEAVAFPWTWGVKDGHIWRND